MNTQNPFEIPQQMRELAERNVEQARSSYAQFLDAMVKASSMWTASIPANDMTVGFKAVQDRALRFSKQNADSAFNMATEIAAAKDLQDLFAIQSRYAQQMMQTYSLQAQEIGRMMTDNAKNFPTKL